jgi:hypothetical protein
MIDQKRRYPPPHVGKGFVAAPTSREIILLTEGAMMLILIHGDRNYAEAAARAAKRLARMR